MSTPEQVQGAIGVAPDLDAKSALSAAMAAGDVQGSVQNAAVAANVGQTTNIIDSLGKQPASVQLKYWNSQNHAGQSRLTSLGYKPPQDPETSHPSSIWGDILGGVKTAAGAVGHAVTSDVKTNAGTALHALNAPLNMVQHVIRAGHVNSEDALLQSGYTPQQVAQMAKQGGVGGGFASLKLIFSPSEWGKDWRETANGEQTFDPAIENQIQKQINDPTTFKVAKALASGDSEQQVLGNLQGTQRQQLVSTIQSPEVKSAVQQLQAAHMSLGREAVGQQFLVNHPTQGKILSGGIDAAYDVAADPTLRVGKVTDAYRLGLKGLSDAELTEHIAQAKALEEAAPAAELSPW